MKYSASIVVTLTLLVATACFGQAVSKPNYALWGSMPNGKEGSAYLRAQARTAAGEFVAAKTDDGTLERGEFVVGGGTWDSETGVVRSILVNAAGKRYVGEATGADALPQGHQFTMVGAGASTSKPKPYGGMFEGKLAELLIFNRLLTDAEQQGVEAYLASRHLRTGGNAKMPELAGLVLHLDAANVEQMGGSIIRWPDTSTHGNDADVRDTGPLVAQGATPAGGPAVAFNGTGYFYVGAKPDDFDGPQRTWYFVFSADQPNNTRILNSAYNNIAPPTPSADEPKLKRLQFNNPGLIVDLGIGLWANPLPMDADGDGKLDLYIASMGKPDRGIYRFEPVDVSPGPMLFRPGRMVSNAILNLRASQRHDGSWVVLSPGRLYDQFATQGLNKYTVINYEPTFYTGRANQWSLFDYDGDDVDDLIIGADDWREYGWDDAFDAKGNWTNGPIRGFVWWMRNTGTNDEPTYAAAQQVMAGDKPVETFGNPTPSFADFNGDGLPDLICGEFLDRMTFFENVGTRTEPKFAPGRFLTHDGDVIRMDLQMIVPTAIDWDGDGHVDLMVGEEDGSVSLLHNTGSVDDGMPRFDLPVKLSQQADEMKVHLLCTPSSTDWDGDGDVDLVLGDSAGYLNFVENLGGDPIKWAAPVQLEVDGQTIRIMAGANGSIQGPAEAKWGYTLAEVADWNDDGLPDILVNNIWGKILWYRNVGTRTEPKLAAAQPVKIKWDGEPRYPVWNWWKPEPGNFVTQWRSDIIAIDLTGDGLLDLVAMDEDGYLALFERRVVDGEAVLTPGKRIFHMEPGQPTAFDNNQKPKSYDVNGNGVNDLAELDAEGRLTFHYRQVVYDGKSEDAPNRFVDRHDDARYLDSANATALRMNTGWAGRSGRRKFTLVDWDRDGKLDLLANSVNVNFLKNVADKPGEFVFRDMGPVDTKVLAGHTTCPTTADLDGDGSPDLMLGAEDGFVYFLANPNATAAH